MGAGPGDPELLTRKAVKRLKAADLVLYDALVSPKTIALASHAQRFFVGKRAGKRAIRQDTIHQLMIRAARRGKRVVRLKGGDPFVLGRGGEEALALAAANVPFEIIPGVTAAVAAPALAGIPVTHRGLSSGFVVVSGHAVSAYRPVLQAIAPDSLTLIVMMGVASRGEIAASLMERGWNKTTPAAMVFAASTPSATMWIGTVEELGGAPIPPRATAGTIIIGAVVSLSRAIGEVSVSERKARSAGL